jgi:branched-chain amino acid transport system ATP-binding protein
VPSNTEGLLVEDLEVRYGQAVAVSGVDLKVSPGSVVALLGANGAGKSSFGRACAGLVRPAKGSIFLGNRQISGQSASSVRRAGLVYLPEGRGIFPSLSVLENVKLAARLAGSRKDRAAAVDRAMEIFQILKERQSQHAGSLSGGEQQMLSLVRALALRPQVVIADELSLGLAPIVVESVFASLERMRLEGITMIIIEQFVQHALGLADHCVILRRGSVCWSGPATGVGSELLAHYLGG